MKIENDISADNLIELANKWNLHLQNVYKDFLELFKSKYGICFDEEIEKELHIYIFSSRNYNELLENLFEFCKKHIL
ncbi:MAG: hypothetical protein QXG26_02610 [Candidatus Aenigmatarchaeota archaeon]